jgi:hypothetical protein
MFNKIGEKIKILAIVICIVGIVASLFVGLLFIADDEILLGITTIVVGVLASWVSVFVLYGFGHLVENSEKMVELQKLQIETTLNQTDIIADVGMEGVEEIIAREELDKAFMDKPVLKEYKKAEENEKVEKNME